MRTVLADSLTIAAGEGQGLRLRLRFEADAADLATLPWETLYDAGQGLFLGLGEASPIVRDLSLPRSRSARLVEPPLRVLALHSSPAGLPRLDVEGEWRAMEEALGDLVSDGKLVLERLASPTLEALQKRLLGEPVHILHFIGHGDFDEASGTGSLALEDGRGQRHLVQGEDLGRLLRNHPAGRLAYLSACEGALASGETVFTGAAQALVRGGVPSVLAMQSEISDRGAIEMARTFYAALASGRPVDAALTHARVSLSMARSTEWAIPVLFVRSPDNRLFDIREVLPKPDCPYPGMSPFREEQEELLFGREGKVGQALDHLRQHPFLAVVGPSGSGKSSFVHAGLIPALRRSRRMGPGPWAVLTMRPSDSHTDAGTAAARAALARLLGCTPDELAGASFEQRTLLFVDQFEELLARTEPDEADSFLDVLQTWIGRPNLYIVLAVRSDFYPDLRSCSLWGPMRTNRLELRPLDDDKLWAAIVEPAGRVGVTVDEALAVQLIADVAGYWGALPLVQKTLVLLWEWVQRRELVLEAYRQMGEGDRCGLQGVVDDLASRVCNQLSEAAQTLARRTILRLCQFGEGRPDSGRQQTLTELRASGDDRALFDGTVALLIESRLLTASGDAKDGARRVDIAHEALLSGGGTLQEWVSQPHRRKAEQTRRHLEGRAAEWVRLGRGEGGLLDKAELLQAVAWKASPGAADLGWSDELIALAEASRKMQRMRRLHRWIRMTSVSLLLLAVLAVSAILGYREWVRSTTGTELVLIAGGPAIIGTDDPEAMLWERPERTVTLLPFQIEKYEVTNAQYRACVKAGPCVEPRVTDKFSDIETWGDYPVVEITPRQAHVYCAWLGRRLPTTVEWERAARGTEGRLWPWGDERIPEEGYEWPYPEAPVASEPETATPHPERVFHLAENVSEWVVRVRGDCEGASCHEAWDGEADSIALMGGAYNHNIDRITEAPGYAPDITGMSRGFRCAADSVP